MTRGFAAIHSVHTGVWKTATFSRTFRSQRASKTKMENLIEPFTCPHCEKGTVDFRLKTGLKELVICGERFGYFKLFPDNLKLPQCDLCREIFTNEEIDFIIELEMKKQKPQKIDLLTNTIVTTNKEKK